MEWQWHSSEKLPVNEQEIEQEHPTVGEHDQKAHS